MVWGLNKYSPVSLSAVIKAAVSSAVITATRLAGATFTQLSRAQSFFSEFKDGNRKECGGASQAPPLPSTEYWVGVRRVDITTETSKYLGAAGGISEICKEGKVIFPGPANGLRPPNCPLQMGSWSRRGAGCSTWAARGPYGQHGSFRGDSRPACHPQSYLL